MSEIVEKHGIVPLKEIEAVALFHLRSFIGGSPYYVCQIVGGTSEIMAHYTGDQLDDLLDSENRGYKAELAALWREFKRNYAGPTWEKKEKPGLPVKLAKSSRELRELRETTGPNGRKIIH